MVIKKVIGDVVGVNGNSFMLMANFKKTCMETRV